MKVFDKLTRDDEGHTVNYKEELEYEEESEELTDEPSSSDS